MQQQKQDHFLHTFVSALIRNSLFKTVKGINVDEETIKIYHFLLFLFICWARLAKVVCYVLHSVPLITK